MSALRHPVIIVFALWLSGLGAAAQYGKLSVTFAMLSARYEGFNTGFLVSLIGVVGIVLGVVAGVLVAQIGYRRTLIAGLIGGAVISLLQSGLPGFGLMALTRVIEGMSHLAIVVSAPTLMAQLSAPRYHGVSLSLWSTFFGVTFALLGWFGVPFAEVHGVGALFAGHGIYMLMCGLAIWLILPKDATRMQMPKLRLREAVADHRRLYATPRLSAPGLGWLFYTFCFVSLLTFLRPFLSAQTAIAVMGALPLVSIAVSLTLGIWLLQRVPAVRVVQIGFVTGAVCAFCLWVFPQPEIWSVGLVAAMGLVQSASFAAVAELNPTAEARAHGNGAMAQMGNLGNALGTPVVAALIVPTGMAGLALPIALAMALGALTHLILSRRV